MKKQVKMKFLNIENKDIFKLLEDELDIEMYDEIKDAKEDWGLGRTSSTCSVMLSFIYDNIYLHIVEKNPLLYGEETRLYSYDIKNNKICKVSQIKLPLKQSTVDYIIAEYKLSNLIDKK